MAGTDCETLPWKEWYCNLFQFLKPSNIVGFLFLDAPSWFLFLDAPGVHFNWHFLDLYVMNTRGEGRGVGRVEGKSTVLCSYLWYLSHKNCSQFSYYSSTFCWTAGFWLLPRDTILTARTISHIDCTSLAGCPSIGHVLWNKISKRSYYWLLRSMHA